jgi:alpha-glucosidase (family GH31 glycosyl hydrolase)
MRRPSMTQTFELKLIGAPVPEIHAPYGATAKLVTKKTHLSEITTDPIEDVSEKEWEVILPALENFEEVTYWLESDTGERTNPFLVNALVWTPDVDNFLKLVGELPPGIEVTNRAILKNSSGQVFRLRCSLPLASNDHVVGFGERFHSIDQRGEFVDAVVFEEYKGQGHRTYLPTPFGIVIGSDYGFYFATGNPSRYDIGATEADRLGIEVDVAGSQLDLEFKTYVGSPTSILRQYMVEFDLPKAPPTWSYGLWASSNEWNTQARVEEEVEASIHHGIELGVIVIEAWSDESTFTVFRDAQFIPSDGSNGLHAKDLAYPKDGAWPHPQKMINDLHEKNIKVLLWQIPLIKEEGAPGSQVRAMWDHAIENGLVLLEADGEPYRVRVPWFHNALMPDLTDAKVRIWWADLHRYLVTEMGIDGFKTDGGEHAWGADLQYLDGRSGLEKNNLFPVAYAQTFHELFESAGMEGITFSRAGFAGSSSYPTFWAGDEDSTWAAYQASIRAGISASASGIFFWGWDIGGFSGDLPTSELYLRGTAMATFCPIMQFHSEFNHHQTPSNDRSPWNVAEQTNDPEVIRIFRDFTKIRTSLIPYLEEEGKVAIATGRPLMAGLFFDYSHDSVIWKVPYQFMLGRHLLVAPVTEPGALTWKVYLPEGGWTSFWTQQEEQGPKWIEVDTPLDRIPVFVKIDAPLTLISRKKN